MRREGTEAVGAARREALGNIATARRQERLGRKTARATVLPDRAATLDFTYSGTELGTFADARIPR